GKLTAEDLLPKMARAMHDEFGQAAIDSATGAQQAVNRLTNAWEDFKSGLDQDFIVGVIDTIAAAVRMLHKAVSGMVKTFKLLGEYAAGNISLGEMASGGFAWLERRQSVEGIKELRLKAIAELKSMLEAQEIHHNPLAPGFVTDTMIAEQRKKVEGFTRELHAINEQAAKEKLQQDTQAKKTERLAQQEHEAKLLAIKKTADDAYDKAMQNNTAYRLAQLKKEEEAAIAAQKAVGENQQRITEIQAEYAKKRQELTDRENRKAAGGGRKASSSAGAGKDITSLEAQINRLRMSGSEFKEWELTNVTIPRMLHDFPNATEKVREFYEAQKKAFADEAAKEAQEENRKQMSERARLLKELSELTGDVNMGQEAQNMLLEQQAQAYRETLGPSMQAYIDKWKELQQLRNSDSFADKLKVGFMDSYKTAMDVGGSLVTAANGWADSFASSLASMAENGKVSFSDLAKSIVSDLVKMTTRMMVFWAIGKAIGMFSGKMYDSPAAADGNLIGNPNYHLDYMGNALGGAYAGGTLSRYSGTVVDRPTLFTYGSSLNKFARGAGLMGEAGPEAILPLTRRNGRLGVDASGSSPRVNVIINNHAGAQVETEQRQNADGSVDIEATIIGAVNRDLSRRGGQLNRTMRSQWGGRSIVTQR
ncbi:MAG: phage tail tape measure protein, partial [Desulfovibrionaceae bacterium]|nr:phage tail tape measure protein [Desulfovibrionaceae bacterium]